MIHAPPTNLTSSVSELPLNAYFLLLPQIEHELENYKRKNLHTLLKNHARLKWKKSKKFSIHSVFNLLH